MKRKVTITTETGSKYVLEHGRYRKNEGWPVTIFAMYCVEDDVESWTDVYSEHFRLPLTVGKRMYISGRDEWWLSTPIVKIEGLTRWSRLTWALSDAWETLYTKYRGWRARRRWAKQERKYNVPD